MPTPPTTTTPNYLKRLTIAIILSAPLIPFLLQSPIKLSESITSKDLLMAAPLALDFLCLRFLYIFTKNSRGSLSNEEQKAAGILIIGVFILFGVLQIFSLTDPSLNTNTRIAAIIILLSAFVSSWINFMRVRHAANIAGTINKRMIFGYMIPGLIACLSLLVSRGINPLIAFYLLKNFISILL